MGTPRSHEWSPCFVSTKSFWGILHCCTKATVPDLISSCKTRLPSKQIHVRPPTLARSRNGLNMLFSFRVLDSGHVHFLGFHVVSVSREVEGVSIVQQPGAKLRWVQPRSAEGTHYGGLNWEDSLLVFILSGHVSKIGSVGYNVFWLFGTCMS